ncbi:MAG: hypothetical protein KGM44_05180 [bacterium]|nr:hypothetical protein [bacterium]
MGMLAAAPLSPLSAAPPPPAAAAVPTAPPTPIAISGQLLDVQNGYLFYTTGDAFRLAQDARISGYKLEPNATPPPFAVGTFALAELDPATKRIVSVQLSAKAIPGGIAPNNVSHDYVVELSPPQANPDLNPRQNKYGHAAGYTGRDVLVTFRVEVPPNTPIGEDAYIATDASGWRADAIKMHRIDGLHFAITTRLPSGTEFNYRYTRGSWRTEERNKAGQEGKVRSYIVPEADTAQRDDTVSNWADLLPGGTVPQILNTFPTPPPIIRAP